MYSIDNSRFGYVYRIVNSLNGKTYIGQRKIKQNEIWSDYYGSGELIRQAISKYGRENFRKELLSYADSREELAESERLAIKEEWARGLGQYNQAIYTPDPELWLKKSEDDLLAIKDKLKIALKSNALKEGYINPSHSAAEKRFEIFSSKYKDLVLSSYNESKSIKSVALKLGVSSKMVGKLLKREEINLNHRNQKGVKHSSETKEKIAIKRKDKALVSTVYYDCQSCGLFYASTAKRTNHCKSCSSIIEAKKHIKREKDKLVIKSFLSENPDFGLRPTSRALNVSASLVYLCYEELGLEVPSRTRKRSLYQR